MPHISAKVERFAVAGRFTIARGAKSHVDVVSCEVTADGLTGRGEGTPIYYRGETAEACVAQLANWTPHEDRARLLAELQIGRAHV